MRATWKPHDKHGELTERGDLPDSVFAYPKERKEPMTHASHVRNAIARFDQVTGVSDAERELAFANIKKAAKHYGVDISETDWHELGRRPSTGRTAAARKKIRPQGRVDAQEAPYRQHDVPGAQAWRETRGSHPQEKSLRHEDGIEEAGRQEAGTKEALVNRL